MSVCAVKIYEDKIVMGADSQVSYGDQHKREIDGCKIWKGHDIVFSTSGSMKEMGLFSIFCKTTKPKGNEEDDVINFFIDFVEWKKKKLGDTEEFTLENQYLFVYDMKAYSMYDFNLIHIKDYSAIGCGYIHAETVLHLGKSVEEAINITCDLNSFCERPVTIYEIRKEN